MEPLPQGTWEQDQPVRKVWNLVKLSNVQCLTTLKHWSRSRYHMFTMFPYHIPQDWILQGSISHHQIQRIRAGDGVKLSLSLSRVQLKLIKVLAVWFCHKDHLLTSLLVVQPHKGLRKAKNKSAYTRTSEAVILVELRRSGCQYRHPVKGKSKIKLNWVNQRLFGHTVHILYFMFEKGYKSYSLAL